MEVGARPISEADASRLRQAFEGSRWERSPRFFDELAASRGDASRRTWVGVADGRPVGFASCVTESRYPPFRDEGLPEIRDLNVAPGFRRRGVASAVLDRAEAFAFERSSRVGVGVGLHPGYRAAQRLYVLRGYVPDGRGLFYRGAFPAEGERVLLDDELLLHLVKERPGGGSPRGGEGGLA